MPPLELLVSRAGVASPNVLPTGCFAPRTVDVHRLAGHACLWPGALRTMSVPLTALERLDVLARLRECTTWPSTLNTIMRLSISAVAPRPRIGCCAGRGGLAGLPSWRGRVRSAGG